MIIRRLTVIGIAIVTSAALLHGTISSALVTRGDDLAFSGNMTGALQKYSLAHVFDRSNTTATDRFAFTAIRSHNAALLQHAIAMIEETSGGDRTTLVMDRALCLHLLGRYEDATAAFVQVARIKHDGRAMLFAALDEKRARRVIRAKELVALAASLEPTFAPARRALSRSSRW